MLAPGATRRGAAASEWSIALKSSIVTPSARPTVSVLIPAWNAGGTIGSALDSVLQTTSVALECIVVDDGSTDDTAAKVEARAASDPRVRLLSAGGNGGVSTARNLGLDAVRGTWLTFLDADDVLLPGGLEAMVEASRRPGTLAVIGQRFLTDGRRRWRSAAYDRPDVRVAGRKSLASHPGLLHYASATGKLFHASTFGGLRFDGRVLGDQPWTIRALLRAGDAIEVIGDDVYAWRRPKGDGPGTITSAKRSSARLAAEATRVAVGALAEVDAEAEQRLSDSRERSVVVSAYFERLVRVDLGDAVVRAVARGHHGADELFQAVLGFLDAAPAGCVDQSRAAIDALIVDPLAHWVGAMPAARSAYLEFLRRLALGHPALVDGMGTMSIAGWGLRLLARSPESRWSGVVASLLFALRWPIASLRLNVRRAHRLLAHRGSAPIVRRSRGRS